MAIKVVLDTNVLISAIAFGGKPREVLKKIIVGEVELFISQLVINELAGVLASRKFCYNDEIIDLILAEIESIGNFVYPSIKIDIIKEDPEDNMILECGKTAVVDYIVSGDKHLLNLKKYAGIEILCPSEFLEII
jgi:uncharacterized protein